MREIYIYGPEVIVVVFSLLCIWLSGPLLWPYKTFHIMYVHLKWCKYILIQSCQVMTQLEASMGKVEVEKDAAPLIKKGRVCIIALER